MERGLLDLRVGVCGAATRFDPSSLDRADAVKAVREWSVIANAANAACALAAARVAECGPPPEAGASSAAEWVAKQTGTSNAKAKERIRNGKTMRRHAKTRKRAAGGGLSPDQAAAVADALDANPDAEDDLLAKAERSSLGELREECGKAKAAADPDPEATERRIQAKRCLRRYGDAEGAEHLHATGTKADMARIDQALKPIIDEIFNQARNVGVRESFEAYAFDALVRLAGHVPGDEVKIRYLGVLRLDLEALIRGFAGDGETCEIAGLGPVPVTTARDLLGESILKLVITRGKDVVNVTHLGRGPSMAQKIALLWQQDTCTREGCGRRARLQYDHRQEFRDVRCTDLWNIDPLCPADHHLKSNQGWALVDGTGTRPMVPPDHPDHPRHANAPPGRHADAS